MFSTAIVCAIWYIVCVHMYMFVSTYMIVSYHHVHFKYDFCSVL